MLEVDRKLKQMRCFLKSIYLTPYLSEPQYIDSYKFENYVGINFAYPIFLRKERGGLKLVTIHSRNNEQS
jgi:hypothetical protein